MFFVVVVVILFSQRTSANQYDSSVGTHVWGGGGGGWGAEGEEKVWLLM